MYLIITRHKGKDTWAPLPRLYPELAAAQTAIGAFTVGNPQQEYTLKRLVDVA